jgi:UDP-glucose 4-epimerase
MQDKRVVITGGAGFIGSNIAEDLSARNEIIIVDDLSSGRPDNIAHLRRLPNVSFRQGSILDLALVREAIRGADYVFHLAALASVPLSIEDPLRTEQVNTVGTLNVLVAARDSRVKKVVFSSSCAVYGDTPSLPAREDMPPQPLSPYAVTKAAAEQYCSVFRHVYGLPAVALRYFNVYGPRQDPRSEYAAVVPRFISRALAGSPLTVFGDGQQTRDFVYVRDVVSANIGAAQSDASGVFNIGSGRPTSVLQLADLIVKLTGAKSALAHQPPQPGEIRHSYGDISRAAQFGYNPRHSIEEGIRETIAALRPSATS